MGPGSQDQPVERSGAEVQALVLGAEDLVGKVYGHLKNSGLNADRDELLAFGRQGLVEAATRFDPTLGEDFRRFAYFRVKGAMLDGVRKMGTWSRRGYERVQMMRAANAARSDSTGEDETSAATLASAEATQRLQKHMAQITTAMTVGLFAEGVKGEGGEVVDAIDASESVEESLSKAQMSQLVREVLTNLPPPEDEVIRRFYVEGEKMDAIAEDFKKSRSWVSRIHSRALKRMGARLRSA